MNPTRLLVLGVVRIFQPTHGYFVRRELLTWRADEWASLNPGSVYNALQRLAREGFLEEVAEDGTDRISYRLTADGETEFVSLLRGALWTIDVHHPSVLMAAVSFMWALTRDEVVAAAEARIAQLEGSLRQEAFAAGDVAAAPRTPEHVLEIFHLTTARAEAELAWARGLLERVRGGSYAFAGEPWPDDMVANP